MLATFANAILFFGVWLNARADRRGFYCWIIGNAATAIIHYDAQMYQMLCRDIAFVALAVYGLYKWQLK